MTRLTLRIDFDGGRQIGHGKVRLLELIAEHGSISCAAREMKMSYRRAWLLTDEVNRMFKTPIIETQHGGTGGGFARLTSLGHALIGHYRAIEAQSSKLFAKQLGELDRSLVLESRSISDDGLSATKPPGRGRLARPRISR